MKARITCGTILAAVAVSLLSAVNAAPFNVSEFGAKGDGAGLPERWRASVVSDIEAFTCGSAPVSGFRQGKDRLLFATVGGTDCPGLRNRLP